MLAEEGQVRLPPLGNGIIVVTVRNRAADHQQKDLAEWVQYPADIARIIDAGKVLQQGRQAGPGGERLGRGSNGGH